MVGKGLFEVYGTSYTVKIVLFVSMLVIGISVIQTLIFVQSETGYLQDALIENKKSYTELLAINLGAAHTVAGFAFQSNLIKEAGKTRDTMYVRFVRSSGEIYMSTIVEEPGKIIRDPAIRTNEVLVKDDVYWGENIKTVIFPVSGGYTVWLGFSLRRIQIVIDERIKDIIVTSLLVLIIANSIAYLIAKKMINPIKELRKGVEIIGNGNLDYRMGVVSGDEIGELASAFNKMTADLKKSQERLEEYNRNLEGKVRERTKELGAKMDELERFNKLMVGREVAMAELKKRMAELEGKGE